MCVSGYRIQPRSMKRRTRCIATPIVLEGVNHLVCEHTADLVPSTVFAVPNVVQRHMYLLVRRASECVGYTIHWSQYEPDLLNAG
jgi:hypothetical protein